MNRVRVTKQIFRVSLVWQRYRPETHQAVPRGEVPVAEAHVLEVRHSVGDLRRPLDELELGRRRQLVRLTVVLRGKSFSELNDEKRVFSGQKFDSPLVDERSVSLVLAERSF